MRMRWISRLFIGAGVVALIGCGSKPAAGPPAGATVPAYAPPRTADGKPDLNGIWQVLNTASWDIQDHTASSGVPAGQTVVDGNDLPYQSWALEKKHANYQQRRTADPEARCLLPGVPRITYMPFPFEIVQTPQHVAIAYEYDHASRLVYMDGSGHPPHGDFWMGDSRGRWEGDTLVIDVSGFNDQTWFDRAGNFHSDRLHVVERYTRTGPDTILYEATIEDPRVFTKSWQMRMPLYRRQESNVQLLEYECVEFVQEAAAEAR